MGHRLVPMRIESMPALRVLLDLPIRTKLYVLSGILIVDLVAVISLGAFGMSQLSSLRAYVGGEGLWAKAQKDAIISLNRYALTRDERDYREFLGHLKIPLGDRKARLALESLRPDLAASDAGFVEGGNHPEDVRGLALLVLRFHRVGYIGRAIRLWAQADSEVARLQAAAESLHRQVASGRSREAEKTLRDISDINERLTRLEVEFSSTLGEASRWARRVLLEVMLLGSALVGALSLLLALLIGRAISAGVGEMSRAAERAARGDLTVRVAAGGGDELGRLAASFNAMVEGLARLDKMKGDFIATVSHELRTPLTLALAPLETLLARPAAAGGGDERRLLLVAHNNAVRLLQMVNGLLDFSKLEAGGLTARREPADAAALAESLVRDFQPIAANRGVELEMHGGASGAYARLDRYLYERILFNLLSNAVKFTPPGGRVGVWVEQEGDRLAVTVKDTGIGISAEDQRHLFQRFRQVESSATRRFEGTGLGLALVKEFAGLHGGSVTLKSGTGRGSVFRVELRAPLCARADLPGAGAETTPLPLPLPEAPPQAESDAGPEDAGLPRVLIAEDNADMAAYVCGLLRPLCRTRIAGDGRRALALARDWRPDLIVTDAMMPEMDGLSLCRAVKADADLAETPVVLLTALTDREAMTRGWEAGADEYLFKPFHPREVVTRVRALLAAVQARRRAAEALARKTADLERSNAELEQFAFVASHDLQEPLRKIAGFMELIEREHAAKLDAPMADLFRRVVRAADQMQKLIDALLRYSRVGRDARPPAAAPARAAFDGAVGNLETAISESGAKVSCGDLPQVKADPTQLVQLFQNLIGNAIKFRAAGRAPTVRVAAERRDGEWLFSVRDDGIGLDMKYADRVFGLFERLHARAVYPGSGIGLATCKKIVERQGGRIWVESAPGKGAAFFFTLPSA